MDASQLLQHKQHILCALKAGQYTDALEVLKQVHVAAPRTIEADPLLAELFSTLQDKLGEEGEVTSCSSEDESDSSESSDAGTISDAEDQAAATLHDGADDMRCNGAAVAQELPMPGALLTGPSNCQSYSCSTGNAVRSSMPSSAGLQTPGTAQTAAGQPPRHDSLCSEDGGQQHDLLVGIKLAASSCSLSHSQRAHLRQQLAEGVAQQKTAAALGKMLADPLLSLSLA